MFCSSCGTLLRPEITPYGKWLACPRGHPQPELQDKAETVTSKNLTPALPVKVSDGVNILAVYDHICKKCGYNKAELIEMSASYSDEDNTYRMKCGRCHFVEQLEGKVK